MTNSYYYKIESYEDIESINYYSILLNSVKSKNEALYILSKRSRDNSRTPMQWSYEKYAGFSNTKPWIDITRNYEKINVQMQLSDENSILNHFKKLISLRKNQNAVSDGKILFIHEETDEMFAYKRIYKDEEIVVLNNLFPKKISLNTKYMLKKYDILLSNYDIDEDIKKLREYESIVLKKI